VSADLAAVLSDAARVAEASGGDFDVTAGPLVRLWRQAREQGRRPDPSALAAARLLVGPGLFSVHAASSAGAPARVELARAGLSLDLGGIAKGYACDRALAVLASRGVGRALVGMGGDLVAGDPPPGQDAWIVSAGCGEDGRPPRTLSLVRAAVATSGDTAQSAVIDGVRYSHVVDPRTGEALTNRLCCTVVASSGMAADAYATALRVSGPTDGQYWLADESLSAAYFDAPDLTAPLPGCSPGEWQVLLAGSDLSGWAAVEGDGPPHAPDGYALAQGVLSIPAAPPGGSLITKADYRDFRLSLDFMLARMANSGVFLRAVRGGGNPSFSGCEIQLLDDFDWETVTRTTLEPWQFCGSLYGSTPPAVPDALNPIGRWSTLDVRYQGSRLAVSMNGRLLYDVDTRSVSGDPPFERRAPQGFLGLQRYAASQVEGDTAVWVANLVVQEL